MQAPLVLHNHDARTRKGRYRKLPSVNALLLEGEQPGCEWRNQQPVFAFVECSEERFQTQVAHLSVESDIEEMRDQAAVTLEELAVDATHRQSPQRPALCTAGLQCPGKLDRFDDLRLLLILQQMSLTNDGAM